jgi:NADPH-dependent FMN reductase
VIFLVPVTVMMHTFWAATDPLTHHIERAMFLKNLTMLAARWSSATSAPTCSASTRYWTVPEASAAVLISSPEYAQGVPGALKNALDWSRRRRLPFGFSLGRCSDRRGLRTLRIGASATES